MASVNFASEMTSPIGKPELSGIYKMASFRGFEAGLARGNNFENSFASAIYGNGPYSLEHPNVLSDVNARNLDLIA